MTTTIYRANLGSAEYPDVHPVRVLGAMPTLPAFVLVVDERGQQHTVHRERLSVETVKNEPNKPSEA